MPLHGQKNRTPSVEARVVETRKRRPEVWRNPFSSIYILFNYSVSIFLIFSFHLSFFCCFSTFRFTALFSFGVQHFLTGGWVTHYRLPWVGTYIVTCLLLLANVETATRNNRWRHVRGQEDIQDSCLRRRGEERDGDLTDSTRRHHECCPSVPSNLPDTRRPIHLGQMTVQRPCAILGKEARHLLAKKKLNTKGR